MKYTTEKLVIAASAIIGFGTLFASVVSLYNDFSTGKGIIYLLTDVIFFSFGLLLLGGSIKLYKRVVALSTLADEVFDELVFSRLKPVLEEMAYSTVELSEVKAKIQNIENKMSKLESFSYPEGLEKTVIGKTSFYMKTVITSMIYIGLYLFTLNYYMSYTPYVFPLLYIIWWAFITLEFRLFSRVEAWLVMGIPILIVPAMAIVLQATIGIAALTGIVFATSLLYAYLYYLYAQELSSSSSKAEGSGGVGGQGHVHGSEGIATSATKKVSGRARLSSDEGELYVYKGESNFLVEKVKFALKCIINWLKS